MKLLTFIVGLGLVIASLSCHIVQLQNADAVFNSSTATTKLHLPQPWLDERDSATYIEQIEVRKLPNSPRDEFLFGALPDGSNFYAYEVDKNLPKPRYGKNIFAVNLEDGPRARVATQQEWESGSRIRTQPRHVGSKSPDYASGEIEYRLKHYPKPGKYWGSGMLSPIFNVCPNCGEYRVDKIVLPEGPYAVCPHWFATMKYLHPVCGAVLRGAALRMMSMSQDTWSSIAG